MGNITSNAVNTTKDIRAKLTRNDILLLQQAVQMDPAAPASVVALSRRGEMPTDQTAAAQIIQWLMQRDQKLHEVLVAAFNASGHASLRVEGPCIAGIAAVLRKCPHLQHLELCCSREHGSNLSDINTKLLISALAANTSLRSLEIEVLWGYTHAACNDMLKAIKTHPGLTLLALKGHRGPSVMDLKVHEGLLDFIRGATALQTLKLDAIGLGFNPPATIKLFEALADNTHLTLTALSLNCNGLSVGVAPALIAYLERSKNLVSLDISVNRHSFLERIVQFMAEDRCSVRSLSLGFVAWGAEAVALMMKTNKTLKVLSLRTSSRSLHHSREAQELFRDGLAHNSTLECLVLDNFLDNWDGSPNSDFSVLADALEHNTSLVNLVFGEGIATTHEQLARVEAIVARNRERKDLKAKAAYVRGGMVNLTTRFGLPAEVRQYLEEYILPGNPAQTIDQARSVIVIDRKTSAAAFEERSRTYAFQLVDALGSANFPLVESICQLLKDCDLQLSQADLNMVLHQAKSHSGIPHDVITKIEAIEAA